MTELEDQLRDALSSRYVIERKLGRGGMATVYLARDLKHGRPVALKVLHPELAAAIGPDRFLLEIQLAARLQHPHILPVFDSGVGDAEGGSGSGTRTYPAYWYAMPYVEGESLRERLVREGPLPVEDALRIARELADALTYAHSRGIIHRDIKPENILLSSGHALVADFGIAKALVNPGGPAVLTEVGIAIGTPAYMSPEQAMGEQELDSRADIYALGCVLYEMLAGEPPLNGPSAQAILARRMTQTAPGIRAVRGGVSESVEQAILKALAPAREHRFPSASHLIEALDAAARPEAVPVEQSIAVLPFSNLSPEPENEYFSDGMTEELINALAKVEGLHVVSRTSAFAFKGRQQDIRAIGAQLNVQTVLEGSIRRAGRRLRLTAQLIHVADGFHLWSDTFDREVEDVFAIQDEISQAIVTALKIKLLGATAGALVKPPTDDLEAYGLYLKGRQFWNLRTEEGLRRGLECFEQALARDPGYALAHAGVADSFAILGFYCTLAPTEAFPRAKTAALRALELDPGLAEAYPPLAYAEMYHYWDWATAEQDFQLAIKLNPGYATTYQWYGNFCASLGRTEESLANFTKAIALDPLSPLKLGALGWGFYFARQYDRAITQCRRALALDPEYIVAHLWLGLAYEAARVFPSAIEAFAAAVQISHRSVASLAFYGHGLAVAGRQSEARKVLGELRELAANRYVSSYDLAMIHLGLGEVEQAMAGLERGYRERTHLMAFLQVDPRLDPLRTNPRFLTLLGRMGFPPR